MKFAADCSTCQIEFAAETASGKENRASDVGAEQVDARKTAAVIQKQAAADLQDGSH